MVPTPTDGHIGAECPPQAIVVRQVGQSSRPEVAAAAASVAQHKQAAGGAAAAAAASVPPAASAAASSAAAATAAVATAGGSGSANGPCNNTNDVVAFGLLLPHWDAAQLLYAGVSYDNPMARASNAYFQVGSPSNYTPCCSTYPATCPLYVLSTVFYAE